jgi:hypothetical protein
MKYKKGSELYVVDNIHCHHFEIGEKVKVIVKTNLDYQCSNGKSMWWMTDEELARVKPISLTPSTNHNMEKKVVSKVNDRWDIEIDAYSKHSTPHIEIYVLSDGVQIAVADLPALIEALTEIMEEVGND